MQNIFKLNSFLILLRFPDLFSLKSKSGMIAGKIPFKNKISEGFINTNFRLYIYIITATKTYGTILFIWRIFSGTNVSVIIKLYTNISRIKTKIKFKINEFYEYMRYLGTKKGSYTASVLTQSIKITHFHAIIINYKHMYAIMQTVYLCRLYW